MVVRLTTVRGKKFIIFRKILKFLKKDIVEVLNWVQINQVKFNPDKPQFIIFSNRNNTGTEIDFQDVAIPALTSFTLLGIDINCKLSWTNDIKNVSKKNFRKGGSTVKNKNYFSSNQFSTIYKSHIRSQMEYCSPLWDGADQTVLGRLDKLQNHKINK